MIIPSLKLRVPYFITICNKYVYDYMSDGKLLGLSDHPTIYLLNVQKCNAIP